MNNNETAAEPAKLPLWAASLVAHRGTEDGHEIGHNARLIKADSESAAKEIALELAREKFPGEGYQYSVALNQIEWQAPVIGPLSVTIKIGR
jgi:hypothetical protein